MVQNSTKLKHHTLLIPDYSVKRKIRFIRFFSIVGIIIFSLYSFLHITVYKSTWIMILALIISIIILIVNMLFLKLTTRVDLSGQIILHTALLLMIFNILYGADVPSRVFWILLMPLLIFYLLEKTKAVIFSLISLFLFLIVFVISQYGMLQHPISPFFFIDALVLFTAITLMSYFYEDTNKKNERKIIDQLYLDPLTGLPNRTFLLEDISSHPASRLILINVDNFKIVNDLYGGAIGDLILTAIARRLREFIGIPTVNTIYKLHADEYAILVNGDISDESLSALIRDILKSITAEYRLYNQDILLGFTIGVSLSEKDILAQADMALKLAKERRIDYLYFDTSMKIQEDYEKNITWIKNIKRAIDTDNITPYYQPIINNKTGKIEKYESLVRMIKDTEVISPYHFLEISKKAKYYTEITKKVVSKSIEFFRNTDFNISLNISIEDIVSKDCVQFIRNIIEKNNIGKRIVFELTETEQIENNKEVKEFIENMKSLGCRIAIDDFGTGYSNFDYILKMNVDFLKLDASLIKNIVQDRNSQVIVETIVDFSKKLNIKTIAEFVHNKEVFEQVKLLSIDYSQGYYLGEPKPGLTNAIIFPG